MEHRRREREGIVVSGHGQAAAAVDQVTVTIAVVQLRADAGQAFRAAAESVTRVLAVLADDGADARAVRTTDLTLGPRTAYPDGVERLVGYEATQRLSVRLDDLGRVERMLSDVAGLDGGAVRIEGLALTPSDPAGALRQARDAAVADARDRADQLARLLGRGVGRVLWVEDRVGGGASPARPLAYSRSSLGADMPVAAGDATVSVEVTVAWAFAPIE